METSWKVESRTDNSVDLQRDGEMLTIKRPTRMGAQFLFTSLRVGQIVHDDMVRIMTRKTMQADHLNRRKRLITDWKVIQNTGDHASLTRGQELTKVERPKPMSRMEFSELLAIDSTVDDVTIATISEGFR